MILIHNKNNINLHQHKRLGLFYAFGTSVLLLLMCGIGPSLQQGFFPSHNNLFGGQPFGGDGGNDGFFGNNNPFGSPFQSGFPGGGQFPGYGQNYERPGTSNNNYNQGGGGGAEKDKLNSGIQKPSEENLPNPSYNQARPKPTPNQYNPSYNQNGYRPNYTPSAEYNNPTLSQPGSNQRPSNYYPNRPGGGYLNPHHNRPDQYGNYRPNPNYNNNYNNNQPNLNGQNPRPSLSEYQQPGQTPNKNVNYQPHSTPTFDDGQYRPDKYNQGVPTSNGNIGNPSPGKTSPLLDVRQEESDLNSPNPGLTSSTFEKKDNTDNKQQQVKQETPAWTFFEPEAEENQQTPNPKFRRIRSCQEATFLTFLSLCMIILLCLTIFLFL